MRKMLIIVNDKEKKKIRKKYPSFIAGTFRIDSSGMLTSTETYFWHSLRCCNTKIYLALRGRFYALCKPSKCQRLGPC